MLACPHVRPSAWLHVRLTAYLWLVASVPLGNWNRQRDPQFIPLLLSGHGIGAGDLGMLAFVSLPAVLFRLAYKRRWFYFAIHVLLVAALATGVAAMRRMKLEKT
ncbi:MAG TPA: hypothetical protein VJN43_03220 [Bryobacteraceae bacterium]|nr:hypothetical protein [Bryobacteraceae bacterium]